MKTALLVALVPVLLVACCVSASEQTESAEWPIVWGEDFDDPLNCSYPCTAGGDGEASACAVVSDGTLRFEIQRGRSACFCNAMLPVSSQDVWVEFDLTFETVDGALVLLVRVQGMRGYFLRASSSGVLTLGRLDGAEQGGQKLVEYTNSPAWSAGHAVRIAFVAKRDQFLILQDGEVVAQAKDGTYSVGQTEFAAMSSSQDLAVLRIDNLVVRAPEGDPLRDWITAYESAFDPADSNGWPQANSPSRNTMFTTYCNGWPEFDWTDVFVDAFDLSADFEWPVGEGDSSRSVYEDGRYVIQGTSPNLQTFHFLPDRGTFRDVAIEADLSPVTGSGSALVVFGYEDDSNYCIFQLSATPSYSLYRRDGGEWEALSGWTTIEGVSPGAMANVRIEIVGQEICVMLNGDELVRVADTGYEGGRIGIGVSTSADPPCTARFDRLQVSQRTGDVEAEGDWTYGIFVRTPGLFTWSHVPDMPDLEDFAVECLAIVPDVYNPEGGFGLLVGYRDPDNFCKFTVHNNGSYSLTAKEAGEWHTIISTRSHSVLRSGGANRIALVAHRQWISLFANGELLNGGFVPQLASGRIALFAASSDEGDCAVYFDDLVVRANSETLVEQAIADLSLGRDLVESGQVEEGSASFRRALARMQLLDTASLDEPSEANSQEGYRLFLHSLAAEARACFQDTYRALAAVPESPEREAALAALREVSDCMLRPEDVTILAEGLLAEGGRFFRERAHAEAIAHLELALPLFLKIPPEEELVLCLALLAAAHFVLGDTAQAVGYAKQTLPLFSAGVSTDRNLKAGSLMILADFYDKQWDYEQAIPFYQALSEIYHELGDHSGEAGALFDLGRCYHATGNYEAAVDCLTVSASKFRELDDGEAEVAALNVLGASFLSLGDYSAAVAAYEEAVRVSLRHDDVQGLARSLTNLGDVYGLVLQEYSRAIEYYEQALDISRATSDESREVRLLDSLGLLYVLLQDYDRAKDYYEEALAACQEAGDLEGAARTLNSLGLLHEVLGDSRQAISYREQAVEAARELGDPWREGESLINLGRCWHDLEDYLKAIQCYERAIAVAGAIPEVATIAYEHMGLSQRELMNLDDAVQSWKSAIGIIEEMRAYLKRVESKGSFMRGRFDVYEELVPALLDTGNSAEAVFYAERVKARILVDMMETAMVTRSDILLPEVQTASRALGELSEFRTAMEESTVTTTASAVETRSGLARAQERAQAEYEAILEELEREHPELSQTFSVNPDRLREHFACVQSALGEGTVALEYFVTAGETILWVISQDGIQTTSRIGVSRQELTEKVRNFREKVSSPPLGRESAASLRALMETGRDLYDLLIAPIEEYLAIADHVVIVPSDILFYVPFGALYGCPDCTEGDLLGGRYMIEWVSVSYAPSLASLYWPLQHQSDGVYDSVLAVGADPDPERPLRYTEEEALTVASAFPLADVVLEARCSEAEIRKLLGQRTYDVVHLSTHGSFNAAMPLLSQVQLLPGDGCDGTLYAGEILGLDLSGSLVVLSACQTALPPELSEETAELVIGDEIHGMGQALLTAGAASAVLTLWNVNDRSTPYLMETMYGSLLSGASRAVALQQAQLSLLEDESGIYSHPCYWAPFVLYGDWR